MLTEPYFLSVKTASSKARRNASVLASTGTLSQTQMASSGPLSQTKMASSGPLAQTTMASTGPLAQATMASTGPLAHTQMASAGPPTIQTQHQSIPTAFGFYPQSTRHAPNPIFYRSKRPSASIRKAPGARRTQFFIGQNRLRLLSATHLVLTEPYFLSDKTAFCFDPQSTRCSPDPIFYW